MIIYKITNNINSKVYVGQTKYTAEKRFKQHCKLLKSNKTQLIYKAIKKYGKSNFSVSVLEVCDKNNVNQLEVFWIKKLDTLKNGYNLCPGGQQWRRTPVLQSKKDKIVSLYLKGESARGIISILNLNCTHRTVLDLLDNCNVQRRNKDCNLNKIILTEELKQIIKSDRLSGMTRKDIAEKNGVAEGTVGKVFKEYNLGARLR